MSSAWSSSRRLSIPHSAPITLADGGAAADRATRKSGNWSAKLTRSLILKSGDELVTLADARVVMNLYAEIRIEPASVALAIKRLVKAAETRTFQDRRAATEQVAIALGARAVS